MRTYLRALSALVLILTTSPSWADGRHSQAAAERLVIRRDHPYSRAEARARLQMMFDYLAHAYGIQRQWQGDTARISGRVMGITFNAAVRILDDRVEAQASDPGFLFRGAAMDYINAKLRKYLHPTFEET